MSFLSELKKQKERLKETATVVTHMDGQRFIESNTKGDVVHKLSNTYGFIVDTKPDDIPALIVDHMYIGSQDCAVDSVLLKYNIKYVLSLGIDVDIRNVTHKCIQCLDIPEADIKPMLAEGLPFIRQAVLNEENVLVHCNAGVSRTSTAAIAYLMHYEKMSFEDAYSLVKEKRPAIQPNAGFKRQLQVLSPGCLI